MTTTEEIIEIIYDLIEELNELYGWKNKLPDLSKYNTIQLLTYHAQLSNQLP